MVSKVLILLLVFCAASQVVAFEGIGDRLLRTFLVFDPLPLTVSKAEHDDWKLSQNCSDSLGIRFVHKKLPLALYFTSAGQIGGLGIIRKDSPPSSLIPHFWKPINGSDDYEITLSFRNTSTMCSGAMTNQPLGDQLVINQDGIAMQIGLTRAEAAKLEWTPGDCITKMGTHWAYDLESHPTLSHKTANLVPILPMYNDDTGLLSAFLVQSNQVEKVEPIGIWEGPFPPFLFCKNLCPPCTFDSNFFSTIHFMVTDPSKNVCDAKNCQSLDHLEM